VSQDRVRFVDLNAQTAELAEEISAAMQGVVQSSAFIGGKQVREFEDAYADLLGVRHCVGVSNGTDALELALRACGVGTGDEAIIPANTFVATAEAVVRAGATPVLVDCDPVTLLIDVDQVVSRIGPRTRVVMPVHLYGQMAPMGRLRQVLSPYPDIAIIEDAAQAQGARQDGKAAGALGLASGTSFYPGKNLGAFGDAGAALTNDDEIAVRLRLLREHGSREKYVHETIGFNCRLDTLQAAVLGVKLRRLEQWNEARRIAADRYCDLLCDVPGVDLPTTAPGNDHVWHLYVVQLDARDHVAAALQEAGIEVGIHYPVPVHLQPAFRELGTGLGSFPVSEAAADRILSLPMHPHLTPADQERVVGTLARALADVSR
jgi:dTDP-4-amino-4,6-dideoxygalactose transaminase